MPLALQEQALESSTEVGSAETISPSSLTESQIQCSFAILEWSLSEMCIGRENYASRVCNGVNVTDEGVYRTLKVPRSDMRESDVARR